MDGYSQGEYTAKGGYSKKEDATRERGRGGSCPMDEYSQEGEYV
jgi:hypothetical protein